jgi:hypothetical protein
MTAPTILPLRCNTSVNYCTEGGKFPVICERYPGKDAPRLPEIVILSNLSAPETKMMVAGGGSWPEGGSSGMGALKQGGCLKELRAARRQQADGPAGFS